MAQKAKTLVDIKFLYTPSIEYLEEQVRTLMLDKYSPETFIECSPISKDMVGVMCTLFIYEYKATTRE